MKVWESSLAEFASHRRDAQSRAIDDLLPAVTDALAHYKSTDDWWRPMLAPVRELFEETLSQDSGGDVRRDVRAWAMLAGDLAKTLSRTGTPDKFTPQTLATYLSTAAINRAAISAAEADKEVLVLTWVTMHDDHVRVSHKRTEGQSRPAGAKFDVDGVAMSYPGDTTAPVELWINCRCMLRPELASEAASLVAASDGPPTGRVIVALPSEQDPARGIGTEDKHMTLVWMGKPEDNPDLDMSAIHDHVANTAKQMEPFSSPVKGVDELGSDGAQVWMLDPDHPAAQQAHAQLRVGAVEDAYQAVQQHPVFTPHVTIGYGDQPVEAAAEVPEITFDRLAVWDGEDRTEYPLGGDTMPADTTTEAPPAAADAPLLAEPLAWHGVLAPEGVWSGDGRQFAPDSLRFRDLPLPLTCQKVSDDGHKGSVTVARIDSIARVDGQMRGQGQWLSTPESDEVVGLVSEFGKFGVSIDADDAQYDFNEDTDQMTFTSARIASASVVPIPAFAEAWVSMGPAPDGFMGPGTTDECGEPSDPGYDDCIASKRAGAASDDTKAANGIAEMGRGPGWLTNPVETKRIHDYWTVPGEEGFVKIGWGAPGGGDFARCKVEVGQEIAENSPDKTRFLNQICAQWHHDALGYWPGHAPTEQAGDATPFSPAYLASVAQTFTGQVVKPAPVLSLVASVGVEPAPAEWFKDPGLSALTPLQVTDEGRVFGHLAGWNSCHLGSQFEGQCVTPPHSVTDYAYFLLGETETTEGSVPTGKITVGGGHAAGNLRMAGALAHYDNATSAVANVTCGEDEHGIWVAGMIRPGATAEQIADLKASPLSGDWREMASAGGNYELMAALCVNTPGFLVPRVGIKNGAQVSLVAAGVVERTEPTASFDLDEMADKVAAAIERRAKAAEARKARMADLAAKVTAGA